MLLTIKRKINNRIKNYALSDTVLVGYSISIFA